jgi:hypothetical protein
MTLQCVATNLRTGDIVADLPGIDWDWPLQRTIGRYDTATARLHMDQAPGNWEEAVLEGASVIHVYDDLNPAHTPLWSGMVLTQLRDTDVDYVQLSLATCDAYFDRRFVADVDYAAAPQNTIVQDLISRFIAEGALPGLSVTVRIIGGSGAPRDETFRLTDNASVYSRLQKLMATTGGPEFTVDWAWTTDESQILPTLTTGDRIGMSAPAGLAPATTWAMPGCVSRAQQTRDYSSGKGANDVTAFSSGVGSLTPSSDPQRAANYQNRPTYEYRWSPAASVTDPLVLDQYAQQALALLAPGSQGLVLTAAISAAPQLGADWFLGDDLEYAIGGLDDQGGELVAQFPGGLQGIGRAIGYQLTDTTISPVIAQANVYTEPT